MKKINSKKVIKFVAQTATFVAVTVGVAALMDKVTMPENKAGEIAFRAGTAIILLGAWNISIDGVGKLVDNIFEDNPSKLES